MNLARVLSLSIIAPVVTAAIMAHPEQGDCVRTVTRANPCIHLATPACDTNCVVESTVQAGEYCSSKTQVVPETTGTWRDVRETSKGGLDGYYKQWVLCTTIFQCQLPAVTTMCNRLSPENEVMVECKRWGTASHGHFFEEWIAGGPGTTACNQTQTNPN